MKFKCLWSENSHSQVTTKSLKDLTNGNLVIKVHFSSLNYKDALGVLFKAPIFKSTPIIGGIDLSGKVLESSDPTFKKGDLILATGCELGERFMGGFSEVARLDSRFALKLPPNMTLKQSMILGTAGFTVGLAFTRLKNNQILKSRKPFLVTGASGGVGSIAVAFLSHMGFNVCALTSKKTNVEKLKKLGASKVIFELPESKKSLDTALWSGAFDNLGGSTLANILPQVSLWGNVASIGLAQSPNFQSSIMPFILRGVSLLGVSSTNCPLFLRKQIWNTLASPSFLKKLSLILTKEITLEQILRESEHMLNNKKTGRTLIQIANSKPLKTNC